MSVFLYGEETCCAEISLLLILLFSLITFDGPQKTIYVEDAETAVKIITKAKDDARVRLQVMER